MPFQKNYLLRWSLPKRGEIIVFRSMENDDIYLVKRVIGLPGDRIEISADGKVILNDTALNETPVPPQPELDEFSEYRWLEESVGDARYVTLKLDESSSVRGPYTIGENELFMMGDNRDNSSDSRVWGALPLDHVLGRASMIWLSCEETLRESSRLCNPTTIRWQRLFKTL